MELVGWLVSYLVNLVGWLVGCVLDLALFSLPSTFLFQPASKKRSNTTTVSVISEITGPI
jgi:hypothetical protein